MEMFEWDDSHAWRRVRILAIREAEEGGGMQDSPVDEGRVFCKTLNRFYPIIAARCEEVDGWMLIESPSIGVLLQEVSQGQCCLRSCWQSLGGGGGGGGGRGGGGGGGGGSGGGYEWGSSNSIFSYA